MPDPLVPHPPEHPAPRRARRLPVRALHRAILGPLNRFLAVEAAGAILLLAAAVVAVAWASSPWASAYHDLWATELTLGLGERALTLGLRSWVADGLMTLFFFVIGLEVKRELVDGELRSARRAAVPLAGAIGGMLVPALAYLGLNAGGPGGAGWGTPMATDVAFAVGVVTLLGRRVPAELKVLLLALAVVDDVGAIAVIAVAYSDGFDWRWALAAAGGVAVAAALWHRAARLGPGRRLDLERIAPPSPRIALIAAQVATGVFVWVATFESGVHPTIAGVALALAVPARDPTPTPVLDAMGPRIPSPIASRTAVGLENRLHPWTSYVIVPLFALGAAGVAVSPSALADAATSRITVGVFIGLVAGKLVGVSLGIALAVRTGLGVLPRAISARHIVGLAALAGIGFTVSTFIAGLAFDDAAARSEAQLGVLAASVVAAALGVAILLPRGQAGALRSDLRGRARRRTPLPRRATRRRSS